MRVVYGTVKEYKDGVITADFEVIQRKEKYFVKVIVGDYDYKITPSTAHLDEDDKGHLILLINRMHLLAREGEELPPHFYTRY